MLTQALVLGNRATFKLMPGHKNEQIKISISRMGVDMKEDPCNVTMMCGAQALTMS